MARRMRSYFSKSCSNIPSVIETSEEDEKMRKSSQQILLDVTAEVGIAAGKERRSYFFPSHSGLATSAGNECKKPVQVDE